MRTPETVGFTRVLVRFFSILGIFADALCLLGQDIPLRNWKADTNWRPPSTLGIRSTDNLISGPVAFQEMDPCRIVDTRGPTGPYGGPSITPGGPRNFTLASVTGNPCAGIPTNVVGFSLNVTALNEAAAGFLKIYPQGGTNPTVSSINFVTAVTIANAVLVASGTGANAGGVTVAASTTTDVLIDINGFFINTLPSTNSFSINSTGSQAAIVGTNTGGAANGYGVTGQVTGNGASSAGVRGVASGTGAGSAGISGAATATGAAGVLYGVLGQESSTSLDSAGVRGIDGTGAPPGAASFAPSGIRGESTSGLGVLGVSQFVGVTGVLVNTSGATQAEGRLGFSTGGANYGVYAATGDIGATGTKSFVVPDPGDPGRVIRYISLEGPEVGTYFRGRAALENREAIIDVPESFRLVTEEEGLSVQVTPIGAAANLWIKEIGLARIVIHGPRDVEFFYTVNGVRKGYADFQALSQGAEFVPISASARLPDGLNPETKRRLIANGTYNSDGTVNLETAERMGWTKIWSAKAAAASR